MPQIQSISVVIPAKNEADNIQPLVSEIFLHLAEADNFEIIYVDDGSTDETAQKVMELGNAFPNKIRLLQHRVSVGQSTAIYSGVANAKGEVIITLDADGQNNPKDIPKLLKRAASFKHGSDYCISGFRKARKDTAWKRLQSKVANKVRAALLKDDTPDTGCGLKVFPRATFLKLPYFDHMHRYLPALIKRLGGSIDATVSAWMMIGCYGILRYALVDGKYRWYALAWFFMGIGVITKGVGFLPMLMLIPLVFYRYQAKASQSPVSYSYWTWWMGPLIMLGAIGLWVIPMLIVVAQSDNTAFEMYRDNILFKQTVTRYADSWHHLKPAYYYVTSVIPVFWLPLSLVIPLLIKPWLNAFKSLDPRIILPLSWVVLVIIFFSISPGKRGVYILPALPMLVLSVAPYYQQIFSKEGLKRFLFVLVACLSMALTVFGILGLLDVAAVAKLAAKIEVTPWYFFLCIGGLSTLGLLYAFIYNKWLAWPIFFAVLWTTYSTYGYVLRNEVSTPRAIYETAKPFLSDSAEIALVDYSEQFILLSPYPMYHFGYNTPLKYQLEAAYQWQSKDNQYLIIEDNLIDQSCFDMEQSIDLGFAHRRHWMLLPSAAKRADCGYKQSQHPVYFYQHK